MGGAFTLRRRRGGALHQAAIHLARELISLSTTQGDSAARLPRVHHLLSGVARAQAADEARSQRLVASCCRSRSASWRSIGPTRGFALELRMPRSVGPARCATAASLRPRKLLDTALAALQRERGMA